MAKAKTNNIVPLIGGSCPMCGKRRTQEFRPFCSKRCADLDLGRWLDESYCVPADEDGELDDESFFEE